MALGDEVALLAPFCQRGHQDDRTKPQTDGPSPSWQPVSSTACNCAFRPPHASIPSRRRWIVLCKHLHSRGRSLPHALRSSDPQTLADSQTPPGRHLAKTTWSSCARAPRLSPPPTSAGRHLAETTWSSCAGRFFLPRHLACSAPALPTFFSFPTLASHTPTQHWLAKVLPCRGNRQPLGPHGHVAPTVDRPPLTSQQWDLREGRTKTVLCVLPRERGCENTGLAMRSSR